MMGYFLQKEEGEKLIKEHGLNEDQAASLRHVAAMFCTSGEHPTPVTLIHGLYLMQLFQIQIS